MDKPIQYGLIDLQSEAMYQIGSMYLYLKRNGIKGWHYALLTPQGEVQKSGYIYGFYRTTQEAAIIAYQLLDLTNLSLRKTSITLTELLKEY